MKTLLTAALLAATISSSYAQAGAINGPPTTGRSAVVLRFAVASETRADSATLPQQACPQTNDLAGLPVDPKVLDAISNELQKRLSKKMSVTTDADPNTIPVGALVVSGCITRADPGNPAKRLIGMNLGTSYLDAHVKVLVKKEAGFVPLGEFDVQAQGGKKLPPIGAIGLAAHAAAERRETLSADATRLADQLLKRLATMMKSQGGSMQHT